MKALPEHLRLKIETECPNIGEIAASKDGELIFDDYFKGYKSGDAIHVMSVTKSVTSLLIGIALDRGLIKSVEQKVLDFFPNYKVKRGEKTIYDVKIRHLMTMTAPYKTKFEPWSRVCGSDNWTLAALDLLGGRAGLTGEFKYSTLGIQILSGIIEAASGMKTLDFANTLLFEPLGIAPRRDPNIQTVEGHKDFIMSEKPKESVWFCDPNGGCAAGFGLCLSAMEMVKIGQLCLNRGEYDGKRVVSSEWIDAVSSPKIKCDESFASMSYGYLWWIPEPDIYAAIGDCGNVIYVNPQKSITVAVASTFKPRIFDRVQFIRENIEPLL